MNHESQSCLSRVLLLILGVWLFVVTGAQGAETPVHVRVEALNPPARWGAFQAVQIHVTNLKGQIWSGSLRIVGFGDRHVQYELRTPELTVGDQELQFPLNLPPVSVFDPDKQINLVVHILDSQGTAVGKQEFLIRVPEMRSRMLVAWVCHPKQQSVQANLQVLADSLDLTAGFEKTVTKEGQTHGLQFAAPRYDPQELPESALEFTLCDLILVSPESLPELKEKQQRALLEWVNAGGSACVVVGNSPPASGLDFLSRLAGKTLEPRPPLAAQPNPEPVFKEILGRRLGLGQVVMVPEHLLRPELVQAPDWRKEVCRLWKIRAQRRDRFVQSGKWDVLEHNEKTPGKSPNHYNLYGNSLGLVTLPSLDQLMWQLKPPNMGMIPLPWLIGSLCLYVLLIGPVDYIVLGWFKARKWTWVVFPLVTLGFTIAIFVITNRVMGFNDQSRSVVIVDIADPQYAPRVSELELRMYSFPQYVRSDRRQELQTTLDLKQAATSMPNIAGNDDRSLDEQAPRYTGKMPGHAEMSQYVRQWSPQFRRSLKLGEPVSMPEFPWKKFEDLQTYPTSVVDRQKKLHEDFLGAARQVFGPNASVYVFQSDRMAHLGGPEILSTSQINRNVGRPMVTATPWNPALRGVFLQHLTVYPGPGLFSFVSQVSPHGGRTIEDLAILDPDDASAWVGLIAVQNENELRIYRRRYAGVMP